MNKKLIKKFSLYTLIILVSGAGLTATLLYAYQDKIIQLFVAEANKHIKTKVQVSKISLSLLDKFPQASVTLDQVVVSESIEGSTQPLASLKQAYFTFNLWDLIRQNYRIRQIYLDSGDIQVKVLKDGTVNYNIIQADTSIADDKPMAFDLEKIALKNVAVSYTDQRLNQIYALQAHGLEAALAYGPANIYINAKGNALVKDILIGQHAYFSQKEVSLATKLTIDKPEQHITLKPSVIRVGPAEYQVAGSIDYTGETYLDLKLRGKNTSIQSMLALLPRQFTRKVSQYQSSGNVYFSGNIKGTASGRKNPAVNFTFGCNQVSFFHPEYKQRIENLKMQGNFTNGKKQSLATTTLALKNINGTLKGRPFSGNITYRNFADPTLEMDLKADLDLAHITGIFPVEAVKQAEGTARLECSFAGNLRSLKANPAGHTTKAAGEMTLQNVNLELRDYPMPFRNLSGHFMLRKNDVAVTDFKGNLGQSDFKLNGYFKNVIAWLLLENQPLLVESDFESAFLNFDELLAASETSAKASASASQQTSSVNTNAEYKLVVSPEIAFDLNSTVKKVQFRRFRSTNIRGNVKLKNQVISSPAISLNAVGGRFAIQGTVDARKRDKIKASTVVKLQDMQVDSLFYVFENFGQDFLVQRHLKGALTADINSDLYFDSQLNPKTDLMQAEIKATVRNGQLNNFDPVMKLSTFIKRRELYNLRFAEISNNFWIQNRTVYIPEMEIQSSVSTVPSIFLAGTHTFDQQMDYKFRIPLAKNKGAFDEPHIETVSQGTGPTLFLTLKGNEKDFKIGYDTNRVKTKIADDLKREKEELKQVFKAPEKEKEKPVEITEDEYFDF